MENVEVKITAKQYSKPQLSLLMRSMLIAGIAFIILGFASYGFAILFNNTIASSFYIGLPIFLLTLISGMVISMLWTANMFKSGSWPLTILCYVLYIATMSVAFGWVFSLGFASDLTWLPVIFLIAGGVFLLTMLIAKLMSLRGIITMGKVIGATALGMMVLLIVFMILMIVFMTTLNPGVGLAGDALSAAIMLGVCVISFLYVIIDIWQIQKISQFNDETGLAENKIMPWFFGYRLLSDLVNCVLLVLIFVLRFARRS